MYANPAFLAVAEVAAARFETAGAVVLALILTAELTALEVLAPVEDAEDALVDRVWAEGDAPLTVTVLVNVVVVNLVEVAGTQLVARRSAARCPELDCVMRSAFGQLTVLPLS